MRLLLSRAFWIAAALSVLGAAGSAQDDPGEDELVEIITQAPEEGDGLAGHGSVSLQLGLFYLDDNGDGNPFLDESLTVVEPVVIYDYNFTDRFALSTTVTYDYVSSASIDQLSNYPDQSGASGDNYFSVKLAPRYQLNDQWLVGGHAQFSTEYDYNSVGLGLNATREAEDGNSSVTGSFDAFYDDIDLIRWNGVDDGTDNRESYSGTLSWFRVMTPKMVGEVGATFAYQTGFLATPYNFVVIEDPSLPPNNNLENNARGFEVTENLPDNRTRGALFGMVRRSVGEGKALELGGRFYADSWDINSVTVEPRYFQTLYEDGPDMRLGYRYYDQTATKYFDDDFTSIDKYRTQDSDLSDFHSHTVGVMLTWGAETSSTWNVGFDYVFRSDGLDYFFTSLGWTWGF